MNNLIQAYNSVRVLFTFVFSLAVATSAQNLPANSHADRVVVVKNQRTLTLMNKEKALKVYKIALGRDPVGPKVKHGDHKTPEGIYVLDYRNSHSQFYKSLHISYPNLEDRKRARKLGVSPGGDIFLHGLPNGFSAIGRAHHLRDWTDGCIAVTDEEMNEIWRAVPDGTSIEIKP